MFYTVERSALANMTAGDGVSQSPKGRPGAGSAPLNPPLEFEA